MVRGLHIFREYFKGYEDRYILIGGTASSLIMEDSGLAFRSTKDLDIILCLETLDRKFTERLWSFITEGKYSNKQRSTGRQLFYRFHSPQDPRYPYMLELFSRQPHALFNRTRASSLIPIPGDEGIPSLSAILLDDEYYDFIHKNVTIIENLPIAGTEVLIPLKAKAWLDLSERKNAGEPVDSRQIRKHRNDIFRLFPLLPQNLSCRLPEKGKKDLCQFITGMLSHEIGDISRFGIRDISVRDVMESLRNMYEL